MEIGIDVKWDLQLWTAPSPSPRDQAYYMHILCMNRELISFICIYHYIVPTSISLISDGLESWIWDGFGSMPLIPWSADELLIPMILCAYSEELLLSNKARLNCLLKFFFYFDFTLTSLSLLFQDIQLIYESILCNIPVDK